MLYLPYEKYEIELKLSPKEVKERIFNNVETYLSFIFIMFYGSSKVFKGEFDDNKFFISRIIRGANSFLPIIKGVIYPDGSGCKIKIIMKLNVFVLVLWIFFIAFFLVNLLSINFKEQNYENFLMLIFIYFFCIIPFNLEVKKAKQLLTEILNDK